MSSPPRDPLFSRVEWLLLAAALAQVAVVLSVQYLPYVDITNHLARYVLMERCLFGEPPPGVELRLRLSPFLGLDALGVLLVHFFPVAVAGKVIAILSVLAPGLGLYVLLRAVCPERRGWALLGCLIGFNRFFFLGFFYYQIGVGLALAWLGGYWLVQQQPRAWSIVGLALFGLALAFVHLGAVAFVGVVVGADWLWRLGQWWRDRAKLHPVRTFLVGLAALGPAVAMMLLMSALQLGGDSTRDFRGLVQKVLGLAFPFYVLSVWGSGLLLGGYALSLAAFCWDQRRTLRWDGFALASIFLLGLYLIFPVAAGGTYDLDVRFVLPLLLLLPLIGGSAPAPAEPARFSFLLVPFVLGLVVAAGVFVEGREIDAELHDHARALELALVRETQPPALVLERGRLLQVVDEVNVLPLVVEPSRGGVPIHQHFAHWHTIHGRGRVPHLFAAPATSFYEHLHLTQPLYAPEIHWGLKEVTPLDRWLLLRDYQAIVLVGNKPEAVAEVTRHARKTGQFGKVSVWRVGR